MPVVLGEEAEGHRGDGVVAPGAVQAAEQVPALLRDEGVCTVNRAHELWPLTLGLEDRELWGWVPRAVCVKPST